MQKGYSSDAKQRIKLIAKFYIEISDETSLVFKYNKQVNKSDVIEDDFGNKYEVVFRTPSTVENYEKGIMTVTVNGNYLSDYIKSVKLHHADC